DATPPKFLKIDTKELAARLAAENSKLRKMLDYCYHKKCLRGFILNYFGERKYVANCATCSSCAPRESLFEGNNRAGTLTLTGPPQTRSSIREQPKGASDGTARKIPDPAAALSLTPEPDDLDKQRIDNAPTGAALRAKLR